MKNWTIGKGVTSTFVLLLLRPMSPLPSPPGGLQLISINSLEAAPAKMDIKVSIKDLVSAIREVEEDERAKADIPSDSDGRGALCWTIRA